MGGLGADESSLLALYMDLTGATEAQARCVYMYVCAQQDAFASVVTAGPFSRLHFGTPGSAAFALDVTSRVAGGVVSRTTSTGQDAWRTTRSAVLPSST